MTDDRRPVGFDSNVLTYFLDGNRGSFAFAPNDPLAPQRVAAVRLFLYLLAVHRADSEAGGGRGPQS